MESVALVSESTQCCECFDVDPLHVECFFMLRLVHEVPELLNTHAVVFVKFPLGDLSVDAFVCEYFFEAVTEWVDDIIEVEKDVVCWFGLASGSSSLSSWLKGSFS